MFASSYDIWKRINIPRSQQRERESYEYRFEYNLAEGADSLEAFGCPLMRYKDLQTVSSHATTGFATPAYEITSAERKALLDRVDEVSQEYLKFGYAWGQYAPTWLGSLITGGSVMHCTTFIAEKILPALPEFRFSFMLHEKGVGVDRLFLSHPFRAPINELPIAESRPAPDSVPRQQSDITSNDELF